MSLLLKDGGGWHSVSRETIQKKGVILTLRKNNNDLNGYVALANKLTGLSNWLEFKVVTDRVTEDLAIKVTDTTTGETFASIDYGGLWYVPGASRGHLNMVTLDAIFEAYRHGDLS